MTVMIILIIIIIMRHECERGQSAGREDQLREKGRERIFRREED
jgi:hypothetical protein